MEDLLLQLHIIGAVTSLLAVGSSGWTLLSRRRYKVHIVALGSVGGWQVLTGAGLLITKPGTSILKVCISGLVYLTVLGGMEYLLVRRLRTAQATAD